MLTLIIGRTCSGKNFLLQQLKTWPHVVSRTTRPQRPTESGNEYFFTDMDDYTRARDEDSIIASTMIGDHAYYLTQQDLADPGTPSRFIHPWAFIVDPYGARQITHQLPDEIFHIVYLHASPEYRQHRFIQRTCHPDAQISEDQARELFNARCEAEDERFKPWDDMFDMLYDTDEYDDQLGQVIKDLGLAPNVASLHVIDTDGDTPSESFTAEVESLKQTVSRYLNLSGLLYHAARFGLVQAISSQDSSDLLEPHTLQIGAFRISEQGEKIQKFVPVERLAHMMGTEPAEVGSMVLELLNRTALEPVEQPPASNIVQTT